MHKENADQVEETCIRFKKKFMGSLCHFTESKKPSSDKKKEKEKLI